MDFSVDFGLFLPIEHQSSHQTLVHSNPTFNNPGCKWETTVFEIDDLILQCSCEFYKKNIGILWGHFFVSLLSFPLYESGCNFLH